MKDQTFRVVLIAPYEFNSFAVRVLQPVLKRAGFAVHSVFFKAYKMSRLSPPPSRKEYRLLAETIADLNPGLVGITVRTATCGVVKKMAAAIRTRSSCPLLVGGIEPSIRPEAALEFADFVCVGEGEEAIVELARALRDGASYMNIQNLAFRRNGEVVKNPVRPLIQDLDALPWIDYTDDAKSYIENQRVYDSYPAKYHDRTVRTMGSRGCPFRCSFCCHSFLRSLRGKNEKYVRQRSAEDVISELRDYVGRHPETNLVKFYDDVFTLRRQWIKDFAVAYKKHINIPFFCYLYPTCVDEEILWHLKYAGVRFVTVGVQSGSSRVRREVYQRSESDDLILETAKLLYKFDLVAIYDVIVGSPYEEEDDVVRTVDLFTRMPKPFRVHVHSLKYFPNYQITNRALKDGLITQEDVLGTDLQTLSMDTFWPDLLRSRKKQYIFGLLWSLGHPDIPNRWLKRLANSRWIRQHPWFVWLVKALMPPILRTARKLGLAVAD